MGAQGPGNLQEVSQWFPHSRRECRVQALPEVRVPTGALVSELWRVVPAPVGQAGRCLGAGEWVSETLCRERLADRGYTDMHPHTSANAQACTYTRTYMCIIIAAGGDGNVVSKGFN